jgi:hypothetical protein
VSIQDFKGTLQYFPSEPSIFRKYSLFCTNSVNIFFNPHPACCETEKGGEGEEILVGQWEMFYPVRIACGNPLYLLVRQVEGGAEKSPPITHTPFEQFEATVLDLQVSLYFDIGQ